MLEANKNLSVGDEVKFDADREPIEIVACDKCSHLMVNIDKDDLKPGDLQKLKQIGVRISNPETEEPVCLSCDIDTWGRKLNSWFEDDDNDDDSGFFSSGSSGLGGLFGGGSFGGGFGGFGGGSFGGGGASRGF